MGMRDKIQFFGERMIPPFPSANRSFPSDSLQRLRDKKAVPGLINKFSNSAPLAQMEVGESTRYVSIYYPGNILCCLEIFCLQYIYVLFFAVDTARYAILYGEIRLGASLSSLSCARNIFFPSLPILIPGIRSSRLCLN